MRRRCAERHHCAETSEPHKLLLVCRLASLCVRQETTRIACEYVHEYTNVLYIILLVIADIVLNILTYCVYCNFSDEKTYVKDRIN